MPVIPGHYDGPEYQRGSVKYSSSVASVDGVLTHRYDFSTSYLSQTEYNLSGLICYQGMVDSIFIPLLSYYVSALGLSQVFLCISFNRSVKVGCEWWYAEYIQSTQTVLKFFTCNSISALPNFYSHILTICANVITKCPHHHLLWSFGLLWPSFHTVKAATTLVQEMSFDYVLKWMVDAGETVRIIGWSSR